MILFLTHAYPDFPGSYRGHFVRTLAKDLTKAGFPVVIVTPRVFSDSPTFQKESCGIEVYRFTYPSGNRQLLHYKRIPYLRMIVFFLTGFMIALKVTRAKACSLIHVHWVIPTGVIGIVIGKILKIPVIVHARGTDMHTYAIRGRWLRALTGCILRNADSLIATSKEIRAIMTDAFDIPSEKISVIPTGIDTDLFCPSIANESNSVSFRSAKTDILYVGALNQMKGVWDLLKAVEKLFPRYPNLYLTMVGEGPLTGEIQRWAGRLAFEKRVRLAGPVPPERVSELLQISHIFVLPSHREGTPNSLLEAMACGIPCVATRVGDVPSIVRDGKDGLLVRPGAPAELGLKIRLLLEDTKLYEEISRNSRKKALQYGREKSLKKIIDIYKAMDINPCEWSLF